MNGASYDRLDQYTLLVNGVRVRASESTEVKIRALSQEELQRFLFIVNNGG